MTTQSRPAAYDQPTPTSTDPSETFQLQGEYLGDHLTPESARTDPTPADLQQAAYAYANAALGTGFTLGPLEQVSDQPVTWQAQVSNEGEQSLLIAKRVVGGYDLYVEGIEGSTEGKVK
jgi:hypothetical protein